MKDPAQPVEDPRKQIPRTDVLLALPRMQEAARQLGNDLVKQAVREAQASARRGDIGADAVAEAAERALPTSPASLQRVINATGVVVHTNLGRAPLSTAARAAIQVAAGPTDVEFDLATGRRGGRGAAVIDALLAAVPGAEAAHVVNNNAAALLLTALALAHRRELVISRGELVEIGDGFRLPDLIESGGARLREVGTTNRTTARDYQAAIGPDTAAILKVHPSNFVVSGFTSSVSIAELSALGVPVVADIGSGLLRPNPLLPDEPDAATALADGAGLVTASGDKLLGGPQAGLLLGRRDLIERLRRHPAARAMRVDKLTLAALEATLRGPQPPIAAMLEAGVDSLRARAQALAARLAAQVPDVTVLASEAAVGGGGAPGVRLPSVALALPETFGAQLRRADPRVVGRVEAGHCLLDLRTVAEDEDPLLERAILGVAALTRE